MKTRKSNKSIKIIAATSLSIFSLVAVFSATFAWFRLKGVADGAGINIKPSSLSMRFQRMSLHKLVHIDKSDSTSTAVYQFDRAESGYYTYSYTDGRAKYHGDPITAYMGEYSLIEPRHPFLAIIELGTTFVTDTTDNRITLQAHTDNHFLGEIDPDTGKFYIDLDATDNPLSSVVQFAAVGSESLTAYNGQFIDEDTSTTTNTYDFDAPSNPITFSNLSTDENGALTLNGWNNDITLLDLYSGEKVKYISIIFDYYDDALNYIYNIYLGNELIEANDLPFTCDWSLII